MNNIKNTPFISVVVCTYNGARKIKNCLEALKKQTYKNFEIIVINDGSTDKTLKIISKYQIKLINNPNNLGLAASRNVGIEKSQGEIIAFTDDDCIPEVNWLTEIVKYYKDKNIIAVGGEIIPNNLGDSLVSEYLKANNPLKPLDKSLLISNNIFYRFYLYIIRSFKYNETDKTREVYSLVGANMSLRKTILNKINFDNIFKFGADEEDLFKRISNRYPSKKTIYTKTAIIYHNFDLELKKILLRNYKYGQGNARMYFKHKDHNLTFYPFPIAYLIALLFVYKLFILILLPNILYFQWTIKALNLKKPKYLFFPYIQASAELFNNIGIIKYCITQFIAIKI